MNVGSSETSIRSRENISPEAFLWHLIEVYHLTAYCRGLQRDRHLVVLTEFPNGTAIAPLYRSACCVVKPSGVRWRVDTLRRKVPLREWPPPMEVLQALERALVQWK